MQFLEDKMVDIWGGNMTAHGQDVNGSGGRSVKEPVTRQLMLDHLEGRKGIGTYCMWYNGDEWLCKWGCADIDTGDWSEAYGLAVALGAMGIPVHIERSRSKGWHLWVFATKPVPASVMRRAFKVAYAAIDLDMKEINPKSESLRPGQLGNYVRLPFKDGLHRELDRQVMMTGWDADSDGTPIQAGSWFNGFTADSQVLPEVLEYWAMKWFEPKKQHITHPDPISDEELRRLVGNIPAEIFRFIKNGPKESTDRSRALTALAYKMHTAGIMPGEAFHLLKLADERWGKYWERPDGDDYLLDIIERTL